MMTGEIVTLRVMSMTPSRATVYVTEPCGLDLKHGLAAHLITLRRSAARWELDEWVDTVWSDCGSAEGNTFPPFPEAREF